MARSRSPSQEAADRRNIAALYLRGDTQMEISKKIGISQSVVSRDLKFIQEEWRRERIMDINEAKQRELARIDALEREYWDGWERSKLNAEKETIKATGSGAKADKMEKRKTTEGQSGDPRFLQGVGWCIDKRCQVLGVDAPKKEEIKHQFDIDVFLKKYIDKFTDGQLARIKSGEHPLDVLAEALEDKK
jgi:predicted transcriptional regulator